MLLPIRTNIRPWNTPYTNYVLIIINAIIFLTQFQTNRLTGATELKPWVDVFMLSPAMPDLWQFITYAFLHGSLMHIVGNMFFLYLFGNNVNDKLGHIGYLCFYLAGAVFSGIGHTMLSNSPVLGASGAVAAVTGAYLVLFPQTLVTVVYWFIFIGTMEISALYFIAFKMIFIDNVIARQTPNVAYNAHLTGYAFGIVAMLIMLSTGLISASNFDLWAMIKQWNRRRRFRDTVSSGYDPFRATPQTKRVKSKEIKNPAQQEHDDKVAELRTDINRWFERRNLPALTEVYLELMEVDNQQILPRQQLLDIANQLASENRSKESAGAYEQFLAHYANYDYIEQVELMLGVLYSRYLDKPDLAKKHLQTAEKKLTDAGQLKMCKEELNKLKKKG